MSGIALISLGSMGSPVAASLAPGGVPPRV
jgi:3-hydroxyisobutyrate dehydrogenase-like beta-hydroxyacid dehydrogenase